MQDSLQDPRTPSRKPAGSSAASGLRDAATILLVGCSSAVETLRRILRHSRWNLLEACTLAQASVELRDNPDVVVVCESVLPDGSWKDLARKTERLAHSTPVIVAANHADDRLWMEVLNSGGYNLISKPFNEREVFHVISTAWRHRRHQTAALAAAVAG